RIGRLLRQGCTKPEAVDQRGQRNGLLLRLLLGQDTPQGVTEVGEKALLVDVLNPLQFRRVGHLSPEGEPDARDTRFELFWCQKATDDGLEAFACCDRLAQVADDGGAQVTRQAAQGCLKQAVLVLEVVRDEPRGDAGPTADRLQGRCRKAHVVDRVDGGANQLSAAHGASPYPRHSRLSTALRHLPRRIAGPCRRTLEHSLLIVQSKT